MTEQTNTPAVDDTANNTPAPTDNNQPAPAADQNNTPADQGNQETTPAVVPNVPASAGDYEFNIDGFDVDAFKTENGAVLDRFHSAGLTNEQASEVVKIWDEFQQVNLDALQQEWGAEYQANVNLAQQAIEALGFKPADLDSPTAVIKLAAAIGKQIQEDLPPQNTQQSGFESIEQLMKSEAYSNANHPEHAATAARVRDWFSKSTPE